MKTYKIQIVTEERIYYVSNLVELDDNGEIIRSVNIDEELIQTNLVNEYLSDIEETNYSRGYINILKRDLNHI